MLWDLVRTSESPQVLAKLLKPSSILRAIGLLSQVRPGHQCSLNSEVRAVGSEPGPGGPARLDAELQKMEAT